MSEDQQRPDSGLGEPGQAWRIGDGLLARAYGRVGDVERSLIKSFIALSYAGLEPGQPVRWSHWALAGGLGARQEDRWPRPWYVLVLDPGVASATQALAALMPAIVRRIPQISVVRPRSRLAWPPAMLTALELAGIENIYSPPGSELGQCLLSLSSSPGGMIIYLGQAKLWRMVRNLAKDRGCRAARLKSPSVIGVWTEPGLAWQEQSLRFVHPGAQFHFWNGPWPEGYPVCPGGFPEFCLAGYKAVYAPPGRWPDTAGLCLGPGREFFWDWPELPDDLCQIRRIGYTQA